MATTMTTSSTSSVYIHVIEDVINKIRDEFVDNGGPGEGVLSELQGIWEMKMMQAGGILGPIDRSAVPRPMQVSGITPVHDLNVPYEGTEEYETPTADILFPPTPLQTPMQTPLPGSVQTPLPGSVQTPLPGTVDNSSYNIPTGSSDYSPFNYSGGASDMKVGRPSMYMPPPSPWMNQRPPLSVDVNVAYEEGREEVDLGTSNQQSTQDFLMPPGKRKRGEFDSQYQNGGYLPQQDGAGDARFEAFQGNQESSSGGGRDKDFSIQIPQLDGPMPNPYDVPIPNPYDGPIQNHYDDSHSTQNMYNYQGVVNEDYNIVNTPAPNDMPVGTPAVAFQNDVDDDDDEPPLNEDDDDDLDDVDQGEDLNTQHLVLAQFDKVTRTKSRWKCTLKDGIMHINNRDILFNKANGEFEF